MTITNLFRKRRKYNTPYIKYSSIILTKSGEMVVSVPFVPHPQFDNIKDKAAFVIKARTLYTIKRHKLPY
jgi:hypothetical protein